MRYLAARSVVARLPASTALLADPETGSEPLHLTVIGHKDDPRRRISVKRRCAMDAIQ
jgi:hypothetical protein